MSRTSARVALLALGFRPFFLLASIFATLIVPLWLLVFTGALALPTTLPATAWHAHEMIFGFVVAVLAGFLLTAVRNWTSQPTPSGTPLGVLASLWLAGRIAVALDGQIPHGLAVTVDLAFVPVLALVLARPIVKARNWRNGGFVVLLGLLFGANLLFHIGGGVWQARATRLAIDVVLLIIIVMGGRVIPSFTAGALRVVVERRPVLERGALVSMALVVLLELVPSAETWGAIAAIAAGALNGARMLGWRSASTRHHPILWVLHLGYAWIAVGLVLRGVSVFVPGWLASAPMHALTVGAIGMLILGMMSRVSLGHTGRMLIVTKAITAAYSLLFLAAVVRSLGPLLVPTAYFAELVVSGVLWSAAFGVFTVVYFPILSAPRVDGKAG